MFHARATFNSFIRSICEPGVKVHTETSEATELPSYRITWIGMWPSNTPGRWKGLVQLDINIGGDNTALAWKRAGKLTKEMGLLSNQEKPEIPQKNWTDEDNPVEISGQFMEYELAKGEHGGWRPAGQDDPSARTIVARLEVDFFVQNEQE